MPCPAEFPNPMDARLVAVVGLGNPGAEYARTRHNAGFMVVDALAGPGVPFVRRGLAAVRSAGIEGWNVVLAKPLTFMNRSGEAVRQLLERHSLTPDRLLVVLDDFNLPFGRLRVRPRGSAGGHNGLESVIAETASEEIPRLRVGIGEESMPADRSRFVLEEWPDERRKDLEEMVDRAAEAVRTILRDGIEAAMVKFNA